jgi:hypothetical protein
MQTTQRSNRPILAAALGVAAFTATLSTASAAIIYGDDFNAYTAGALAGQAPWAQNSTVATNPVQIAGGKIVTFTTGQDVFTNFSASIPATDGTFAYFGLTINISAATATGDYFAHFTNGVANPTAFSGRLAARLGTTGFQLGYSESTAGGTTFGTTDLAFNTDYRVIVRYGFVAGTLNDTGAVFATLLSTPFDPIEANNTPYVTDAYNGATGEIGAFTGFQFRQGGATTAASVASMDDLSVATTFAEVIAVPEPTAFAALLGGASLLGLVRRRRS